MPELPEVDTVRRGLEELIIGREVLNVNILNQKSFPVESRDIAKFLIGAKIIAIRRRAKVLIIDLSNNYSLVIHLKMTGQIVFRGKENWGGGHPNDSLLSSLPDRSTRVEFKMSNNTKLFFNDQRKFGWVKLLSTADIEKMEFIVKLGPEPLIGSPKKEFLKRIRRRNGTTIKAAILDQTVIAGIGNIYADESLWAAKIHPATRVKDLSDKELIEILTVAIRIMKESIDAGGSTMRNYINADGSRGDYLELFANVFNKDGKPCKRCGAEIIKIRVAARGTHICPKCQRLKSSS